MVSVNSNMSTTLEKIDERANLYLKEMERRAKDRLLKYQYYMAKAYEYRMLKPYTGEMNLNRLFDAFANLAKLSADAGLTGTATNEDHELTEGEFDLLKGVYLEELSRIMAEVFDELNTNAPERSVPVAFALTPDELKELNTNGSLRINLMEKNLFGQTEENLRICDLRTESLKVHAANGADYGGTALLRVKYEHSGRSTLTSRGKVYTFNHYRTATVNPLSWKTVYDGITGTMTESHVSAASESLLHFLLERGEPFDGEHGDVFASGGVGRYRDLERGGHGVRRGHAHRRVANCSRVRLLRETQRSARTVRRSPRVGSCPRFGVENTAKGVLTDVNGRGDGRGDFLRVFNPSETVRLKAPATYGTWVFDHWSDATGQVVKALNSSVFHDAADDGQQAASGRLCRYRRYHAAPRAR